MKTQLVKDLLALSGDGRSVTVRGWVRTKRETKNAVFIEANDGSCFKGIQCVFDLENQNANNNLSFENVTTGASVEIEGTLIASPAKGQSTEVKAEKITVLGTAPVESYPLQKKAHSLEFLREIAHLRARTNTYGAVARLSSQMQFAIHSFFTERGFHNVHTPLITGSDAEGAGAMFQVTTLDLEALAKSGKDVDYAKDFFGKKTHLTVSGQLNAETYATALGRVYTFGPTFRAENSNTTRHLAEFWMVEPEMSFATLDDDIELAEDFLKYLFNWALTKCADDLEFFDDRIQKGLIETLTKVANAKFGRITYTDAIKELEKHADKFEFKPYWGCDIQTEHERFIADTIFNGPGAVTDYPKEIKAFYMRLNDDEKTVRAMDVIVPRLGEIIGGSEREYRYDVLVKKMVAMGMKPEEYSWYLDTRKYGTVPHAGFGLGFERLLCYVSGMSNIRDVIPFPRAVKSAEF